MRRLAESEIDSAEGGLRYGVIGRNDGNGQGTYPLCAQVGGRETGCEDCCRSAEAKAHEFAPVLFDVPACHVWAPMQATRRMDEQGDDKTRLWNTNCETGWRNYTPNPK